jgi:hypothetical protein
MVCGHGFDGLKIFSVFYVCDPVNLEIRSIRGTIKIVIPWEERAELFIEEPMEND